MNEQRHLNFKSLIYPSETINELLLVYRATDNCERGFAMSMGNLHRAEFARNFIPG